MKKFILLLEGVLILTLTARAGEPYKTGDYASDFHLMNVDGKYLSLSQIKNAKGFIVVFICNTCPVVKNYESRIIALNEKYSSKGFPVIAINSNDKNVSPGDSFEEMKKLVGMKEYKFPYLYDESQEVVAKYGATNTPHVYVLSKTEGKLKVEYVGAIDNNSADPSMAQKKYVEDAVNALISGERVPISSTKAVGCSIKWKRAA